jgi:hypothetical protein
MVADPHFARDTHMRIILGNSGSAVGRSPTSILSSQPSTDFGNSTSGGRYVYYTTLSKKYPTLGQEKKVAYLWGLNS